MHFRKHLYLILNNSCDCRLLCFGNRFPERGNDLLKVTQQTPKRAEPLMQSIIFPTILVSGNIILSPDCPMAECALKMRGMGYDSWDVTHF